MTLQKAKNMLNILNCNLDLSCENLKNTLHTNSRNIVEATNCITQAIKSGHKVLVFGNGGSAADSQHLTAELVGRFLKERRALPVIALTTNTSILTAIGNDYSYDKIFSRQIEAIGKPGDITISFSTSGNSKNVIEAIKKAKALGLYNICFTGNNGGKLGKLCNINITSESKSTPRIQESHLFIFHCICELIELQFLKEEK